MTSDGAGGQTKTYEDLDRFPTVWASVAPVRGNESFTEDRTNATGMYLFTIRNRTDIDERTTIIWRDESYNIRQVKRAGGREMYLKIEAERGV